MLISQNQTKELPDELEIDVCILFFMGLRQIFCFNPSFLMQSELEQLRADQMGTGRFSSVAVEGCLQAVPVAPGVSSSEQLQASYSPNRFSLVPHGAPAAALLKPLNSLFFLA